ncbi:nuclear transport factor 2 family protein [Granulicella tundricola]|uniref:DUF4440 domain-containing protein n=1 Tax=Granulicella tundricola (strain ATCC BAA-1859 / DSM 23138 / MP5ACTX9) TaxID=1198114 RepID=E8X5I8_GRATM|nr:nuclear transport factor 2 family protein [Granulicella tundricola]ADW70615.1 hypothetical protein AciX9_3612 [Granulicella tundricola MP5ACTX9]
MSRRSFILALLLAAFITQMTPRAEASHKAHTLKKKDYKHEIEGLEEQWRVAQIAGDVTAMDNLLSDDYVGITINGMVNTKAQQLDRIRTRALTVTRMDLSDTKIKLVGSIAVVTCRAEIEGMNDGTPVNGTVRYTRVYQRLSSGTWKITNFEVTRVPHSHRADVASAAPGY